MTEPSCGRIDSARMDASVAASTTVSRLGASTEGIWLRSRSWDLSFLILSAALVPDPAAACTTASGVSQTAVNLIVAGLIGGPHLYSTFTYTFMEPNYRKRHKALPARLAGRCRCS